MHQMNCCLSRVIYSMLHEGVQNSLRFSTKRVKSTTFLEGIQLVLFLFTNNTHWRMHSQDINYE